ncbi:MAG: amidohydrolase family protein [Armatimonadota bacterium]
MASLPTLFNANALVGFSAAARPDFPACADLLEHMDRLGIARSLTYHAAAKDFNQRWGNSKLLEDIASTPGARERIIPAFSIAATMLYERGTLDWLKDTMAEQGIRALRFPLTRGNWTLGEIEPVVEELLPLNPVLLLDFRDPIQKWDILDFAAHFPQLPIIYTGAMWVDMVNAFDLMRRRENILLETSWLHSNGDLERTVRLFGVERIVFGTGYKSNHGASIAALMNAQISDEERELIAHGNLDRMLGLAQPSAPVALPDDDTLWSRMLNGKTLGVDVIDAHAHIGEHGMWVMEECTPTGHAEMAAAWMDRAGVSMMIASGEQALFTEPVEGNLVLEDVLRPYGDRFKGYLAFNPIYADELMARVDDFFSRPFFIGFKTLCDYWRVPTTDPRYNPMWAYANAHCLPILLHTWGGPYDAPVMLKDIAPAYPDAIFILGHSGGDQRQQAVDLAMDNPNVYLEFCGSFTVPYPWEEVIDAIGSERILLGTDGIFHNPDWEMGRLLSHPVPEEQLIPILGENMRKILARRKVMVK